MPVPRGGGGSQGAPRNQRRTAAPPSGKSGWGAVASKKKEQESKNKQRNNGAVPYLDIKNKFILKDGESAVIQFITEEPECADGCTIPPNFDWYASRKGVDKNCPMIDYGLKPSWKAGFKVLDHRGKWSKDDGDFTYDEPVERYWLVSNTVAAQLFSLVQRKGQPLTEMVLEVTRSGADKSTTYNFEMATRKGKLIEPFDLSDYEEVLPSLKKAMKPLPAEDLEELLGVEEDTPARRSKRRDDDDDDDRPRRNKDRASFQRGKSSFKKRGRRDDDEYEDDLAF